MSTGCLPPVRDLLLVGSRKVRRLRRDKHNLGTHRHSNGTIKQAASRMLSIFEEPRLLAMETVVRVRTVKNFIEPVDFNGLEIGIRVLASGIFLNTKTDVVILDSMAGELERVRVFSVGAGG